MTGTPKAYLFVELDVHDPAEYENYKAVVPPIIAKFGGRYLVRGGTAEAIEGDGPKGRVAVLEFPDTASAHAFLSSDEYRPVAAIRHRSATSRVILVEGVAP
jgi:uncharacterized protein (DUF1330 family)